MGKAGEHMEIRIPKNTTLFVCEASDGVTKRQYAGGAADHCSAPEAAEMARDAGAQVLLLTYYPDKVDPNAIRNAARSVFKGEVHVVQDGDRFSLAQRNLGQYLGGAQGRTQGGRSP
jgi:ribonuclease BN (tRNA processing enzyme)